MHEEYLRGFDTTKNCINSRTARLCTKNNCNGKMLPEQELSNAISQTEKADLCIVFGSLLCSSITIWYTN